jgi:hypothetical protein
METMGHPVAEGGGVSFVTGEAAGVSGASAVAAVDRAAGGTSRKAKKRAAKFNTSYGQADMRAYPIYKGELLGLGGISVFAAGAFSLAGSLFTFAVDTSKDLDLALGTKPEVLAYWSAARDFAQIGGIVCFIVGLIVIAGGAMMIRAIFKRTKFDED